jgi:hypothetical protein
MLKNPAVTNLPPLLYTHFRKMLAIFAGYFRFR